MCQQGDVVVRRLGGKRVEIDRCIAPLVDALNKAGISTERCRCGHGVWPGWIHLKDGRSLILYDRNRATKPTCASTHIDLAEALGYYPPQEAPDE